MNVGRGLISLGKDKLDANGPEKWLLILQSLVVLTHMI